MLKHSLKHFNPIVRLLATKDTQSLVINKLLAKPVYQKLCNITAPSVLNSYDLTVTIKKILEKNDTKLEAKEKSLIYNDLIENLTSYDYSVATVGSKALHELNQPLSLKSIDQIIQFNPGRSMSSWEIFIKYYPYIEKDINSEKCNKVLLTVLSKLIWLDDAAIKDGQKYATPRDILHAIFIIYKLNNQALRDVPKDTIKRLYDSIIATNSTILLPNFFEKFDQPISTMDDVDISITKAQYLLKNVNNFVKNQAEIGNPENREDLYKVIELLGHNNLDTLLEPEEKEACKVIESVYTALTNSQIANFSISSKIEATKFLDEILKIAVVNGITKKDVKLCSTIVKTVGLLYGDMDKALKLYHSFMIHHREDPELLVFASFMTLILKSFEQNNPYLLAAAKAMIPPALDNKTLKLNILRCLILVNCKFNIDESLQLYNENISTLSKKNKEEHTGTIPSDSALLTETLILAYLYKGDRDFAHVILDGAMKNKLVEGPTAVKRIKKLLSYYGDVLEETNCKELMENKVGQYIKHDI
ncbi:uncharacterized protein SCODWIG_02611 [Saccharomycodes ludwigii]|uniref:Uncharacterized protein n=1 Tax=Saccharomycodes ludwigii TaxID=36035 RepID=A0A376B9Q0_9ASCO|nr:hypothetical protein SCDLUD_004664 [Saccharomycodes ludwigii]KAH3899231.1 hypothetical protein SCDLUD_004664 [Saccharomycodes ludwigii]SSD60850.1 uncharacterized protein SCODWIG_02611 [Saccharomycodes ludwigii]